MSGKKKNGSGSFLSEFSFVLAVLVLVAALGGIFFFHRMRSIQEEEKLEQIIANEKSPQITGAKVLSEQIALSDDEEGENLEFEAAEDAAPTVKEAQEPVAAAPEKTKTEPKKAEPEPEPEPETEPKAEPKTEEPTMKLVEVAASEDNWTAAMPIASLGEAVTEAATKQEAAVEQTTETTIDAAESAPDPAGFDVKKASILIINGTYKNGVASYWETKLREQGYTDILKASYSGKAEQLTAIYGVDKAKAEAFKEFFPTAEFRDGAVPAGFTMADGSTPPTTCDYYIVVGIADAINS